MNEKLNIKNIINIFFSKNLIIFLLNFYQYLTYFLEIL